MADRIQVSTVQLKIAATLYQKLQSQMMDTCIQMNNTANVVTSGWKGKASNAFSNAFNEMYAELKQTDDKMQDAVEELMKVAGIFDEAESSIKSTSAALDTGISPFA